MIKANAASEGINRLIKLEARNAFGFRNPSTNASDHAARASERRADQQSPANFEDPETDSELNGNHAMATTVRTTAHVRSRRN